MSRMERAVGYCLNEGCEDYAKGVFLLNRRSFNCPHCGRLGLVEMEVGMTEGEAEYYSEVRVHYNYALVESKYREIAVVKDTSLPPGKTFYLFSPTIRTEKRALYVAEAALANLNFGGVGVNGLPKTHEVLLSFDDSREDFSAKLQRLAASWENSQLCKALDKSGTPAT